MKRVPCPLVLAGVFALGAAAGAADPAAHGPRESAPAADRAAASAAFARGDMAACKAALDAWLANAGRQATEPDPALRWQKLMRTPDYLSTLAQSELLRATGPENVAKIAATPPGRQFLSAFLADPALVEMYLASGPVPTNTPDGLATLRDLWLADRAPDAPKYRHLATAVALVFNTDPQKRRLRRSGARRGRPDVAPGFRTGLRQGQGGRPRPVRVRRRQRMAENPCQGPRLVRQPRRDRGGEGPGRGVLGGWRTEGRRQETS